MLEDPRLNDYEPNGKRLFFGHVLLTVVSEEMECYADDIEEAEDYFIEKAIAAMPYECDVLNQECEAYES